MAKVCRDQEDYLQRLHRYLSKISIKPPSGLSLEDVLEKTRVAVFERYETKKNKDAPRKCPQTWLPTEWQVFTTYGKSAPNPEAIFNIEYVNRMQS